jgi:hypothetical protein
MENPIDKASPRQAAGIAGAAFLFVLMGYTISWILVYAKLIVADNAAATARNIMAHERLFRIGIVADLLVAIAGIVLAWALYILLRSVNKNLALLALLLKLMDAVLALGTVSFSLLTLRLLPGEAEATVFQPEQLLALAGRIFNFHAAAATIPMVLAGLGFIVFFYLLFQSKYIPRILSGFGIFSYGLIVLSAFGNILGIKAASGPMSPLDIILFAPSILFELTIGLWLLSKGANGRLPTSRGQAS